MPRKAQRPIRLIASTKDGVINVVTYEGYKALDKQTRLYDKFFRSGLSLQEATNKAREIVPDPPRVSFALDRTAPLRSPSGQYGHAGYYDLFESFMDSGEYEHPSGSIKVYNSGQWDLPTPTEDVIKAIFGENAVPIFRQYQRRHGL